MTDTRIEHQKGSPPNRRDARAKCTENLDGALIEVERNGGRAKADCLRTISRVVGQPATVEWILREEDE
jgi:hypothetical protein